MPDFRLIDQPAASQYPPRLPATPQLATNAQGDKYPQKHGYDARCLHG